MRVQVAYLVPVEVVVDLETGTVERVVVIDESIELDLDEGVRTETKLEPVEDIALAEQAVDIADTREWPDWEFGW